MCVSFVSAGSPPMARCPLRRWARRFLACRPTLARAGIPGRCRWRHGCRCESSSACARGHRYRYRWSADRSPRPVQNHGACAWPGPRCAYACAHVLYRRVRTLTRMRTRSCSSGHAHCVRARGGRDRAASAAARRRWAPQPWLWHWPHQGGRGRFVGASMGVSIRIAAIFHCGRRRSAAGALLVPLWAFL